MSKSGGNVVFCSLGWARSIASLRFMVCISPKILIYKKNIEAGRARTIPRHLVVLLQDLAIPNRKKRRFGLELRPLCNLFTQTRRAHRLAMDAEFIEHDTAK